MQKEPHNTRLYKREPKYETGSNEKFLINNARF